MRTWWANSRDLVRTRLWPVPTIAVTLALLLGLGLPELDAAVDEDLPAGVKAWLFGGDADAARTLLDAISSSMITVTALTFSLTVVTLQLASSQFSPRLLRTFAGDQFVQATLALFLATFTYSLTVLRAVRSGGDGAGEVELVPQIAVTVSFVLALASVVALVLFLAHLTQQIRPETMLRDVHDEALRTLRTTLPERDPAAGNGPPATPGPPPTASELASTEHGFLTWIDHDALLEVAADEATLLSIDVSPGDFVVVGTPLGTAWPRTGGRHDDETTERIAARVADCLQLSFERTSSQDVGFGLRQLVDVANKGLSPGINDPTTAVHALGHISAFLCVLVERDLAATVLRDEDEEARVVLRGPDLADFVDLGLSQPRRYGAEDPQVLARILQVLLDLARRVAPDQRSVVVDHLDRVRRTVAAQSFDQTERRALEELGVEVERTLGRH